MPRHTWIHRPSGFTALPYLSVDLLHLFNDVVRDSSLSQQHVELTWHAASDGMDAELYLRRECSGE